MCFVLVFDPGFILVIDGWISDLGDISLGVFILAEAFGLPVVNIFGVV